MRRNNLFTAVITDSSRFATRCVQAKYTLTWQRSRVFQICAFADFATLEPSSLCDEPFSSRPRAQIGTAVLDDESGITPHFQLLPNRLSPKKCSPAFVPMAIFLTSECACREPVGHQLSPIVPDDEFEVVLSRLAGVPSPEALEVWRQSFIRT